VDDQGQLRTGCWVRAASGSTQGQKPGLALAMFITHGGQIADRSAA
jgi:hypothetical protein